MSIIIQMCQRCLHCRHLQSARWTTTIPRSFFVSLEFTRFCFVFFFSYGMLYFYNPQQVTQRKGRSRNHRICSKHTFSVEIQKASFLILYLLLPSSEWQIQMKNEKNYTKETTLNNLPGPSWVKHYSLSCVKNERF